MAEVKLSTGKVVNIDVSKVTFGEWRAYFTGRQSAEKDDEFVTKITSLKHVEIEIMLRDDYRRVLQAILKAGSEPLADPS